MNHVAKKLEAPVHMSSNLHDYYNELLTWMAVLNL